MKKKLLKTFLLAAGLLVGGSAWGDTITQIFDFAAICSDGDKNLDIDTDNPVTVGSTTLYMPKYDAYNLQGRFAFTRYYKGSGSWGEWYIRKTSGGLFAQSPQNGTPNNNIAILSLKEGDKVTITTSFADNLQFDGIPNVTNDGVDDGTAIVNNQVYTIKKDGELLLKVMKLSSNINFVISKIVIETEEDAVSKPLIGVIGANKDARTIELTAGKSISGTAATATYYTIDGSEPSNTNGTLYSGTFTVNGASNTIKAISYVSSTASEVAMRTVAAGSTIVLPTPTITLTGLQSRENDCVSPIVTVVTSTTGLIGRDAATVSYTFTPTGGSASNVFLTDGAYTFTRGGTLTATVACEGYISGEASITLPGLYYKSFESEDFSLLADASTLSGTWNVDESTDAWSGWTSGSYTRYTRSRDGFVDDHLYVRTVVSLVINYGFSRNNSSEGYYRLRNLGEGSIGYIVIKSGSGASDSYKILTGTAASESSYLQFSMNNKECISKYYYYTPIYTVPKPISAAGWATYCSPYALDFSGDIDNLTDVYIITGSKIPGAESGYVATTSVKGGTVAAGTGLLIKGTEGTITIPVATSGTDYSGTNKLVGVTTETTLDLDNNDDGTADTQIYVLMNDAKNGLGFYLTAPSVTSFTLGANTAYLPADFVGVAGARSFFGLFDDVTGINGVESANKEQNQVYNLNGQRVAQPSKGLYIINGKKVVMK